MLMKSLNLVKLSKRQGNIWFFFAAKKLPPSNFKFEFWYVYFLKNKMGLKALIPLTFTNTDKNVKIVTKFTPEDYKRRKQFWKNMNERHPPPTPSTNTVITWKPNVTLKRQTLTTTSPAQLETLRKRVTPVKDKVPQNATYFK